MYVLDSHLADNGLEGAEPFATPKVTLGHSNISYRRWHRFRLFSS